MTLTTGGMSRRSRVAPREDMAAPGVLDTLQAFIRPHTRLLDSVSHNGVGATYRMTPDDEPVVTGLF